MRKKDGLTRIRTCWMSLGMVKAGANRTQYLEKDLESYPELQLTP